MSWQVLIWNMFVWIFTGVMIYVTDSSLWWLLLPALFTGTQNVAEIVRGLKEEEVKEDNVLDEETKAKMIALRERAKRGSL